METMLERGYRVSGPVITLVAPANAGALALYTVPTAFAAVIGTKTFIPKKLMVRNNGAGNTYIHLGTGLAGAVVDAYPPLLILNNIDGEWQEVDIPAIQFFATLMFYADAIGAGIQAVVEVEENG